MRAHTDRHARTRTRMLCIQADRMQAVAHANRQEQQNYMHRQQQLQAEIEQVSEGLRLKYRLHLTAWSLFPVSQVWYGSTAPMLKRVPACISSPCNLRVAVHKSREAALAAITCQYWKFLLLLVGGSDVLGKREESFHLTKVDAATLTVKPLCPAFALVCLHRNSALKT